MDIAMAYVLTWLPVLAIYAYKYPSGRVRTAALAAYLVSKGIDERGAGVALAMSGFPVVRQKRTAVAGGACALAVAYALSLPLSLTAACILHCFGRGNVLPSCSTACMLHYAPVSMTGPLCCIMVVLKHHDI